MREEDGHTDLGGDRDVTIDDTVQARIQVLWEEFDEQ